MKILLYLTLGALSVATVYWLLNGDLEALLVWILFYGSSGFKVFEGKQEE